MKGLSPFRHFTIIKNISRSNVLHAYQASYQYVGRFGQVGGGGIGSTRTPFQNVFGIPARTPCQYRFVSRTPCLIFALPPAVGSIPPPAQVCSNPRTLNLTPYVDTVRGSEGGICLDKARILDDATQFLRYPILQVPRQGQRLVGHRRLGGGPGAEPPDAGEIFKIVY